MRLSLILSFGCAATAAGLLAGKVQLPATRSTPPAAGEVRLLPFGLMDGVRRADVTVPMKVQLYNGTQTAIRPTSFRVRTVDGFLLAEQRLDGAPLAGDGGDYLDLQRRMEEVDPALTHRYRRRFFLPLEQRPVLDPATEAQWAQEIAVGIRDFFDQPEPPVRSLRFELDLARTFPTAAEAGDSVVVDLTLFYDAGAAGADSVTLTHEIVLLPPYLPPPPGAAELLGGGSWVRGDLHVHNCRDEASGGCPDCAAESFNTADAFSNADLKTQFLALGMDFFSNTTHSYCINSDAEFQAMRSETLALDEPGFVVLCGTELSGRETGTQTGSDSANALCFLGGGSNAHHMGAHNILTRKPGGGDGFLDFCDDPLFDLGSNTAAVNSEGGFCVANHPASDYWAFNSTDVLTGIEADGLYGVEIWNGTEGTGTAQSVHRSWWIDRLLDGRVLYPFSGSDTHDAAFDFGAVHTLLSGPLTDDAVADALRSGKSYLSNGPFLGLIVRDNRGRTLEMGGIASVLASRIPPGYPLTVKVLYDAGAGPATLRVYRGTVGVSETLLQQFSGVSGSGAVSVPTTLPSSADSWYRAELVYDDATQAAYTTPGFVRLR